VRQYKPRLFSCRCGTAIGRIAALIATLALAAGADPPVAAADAGGDPARGRAHIARVGCGVCHVIPGVHGPGGVLGPSLAQFGSRLYLAGSLPNRPPVLEQFVRNAPSLVPNTAMPDLPLDEQEARDIAAYLYTLR
jgi:cytochrome c1